MYRIGDKVILRNDLNIKTLAVITEVTPEGYKVQYHDKGEHYLVPDRCILGLAPSRKGD